MDFRCPVDMPSCAVNMSLPFCFYFGGNKKLYFRCPKGQPLKSSWALGIRGLKAKLSWAVSHSFIHPVFTEHLPCAGHHYQHREPWRGMERNTLVRSK